MSIITISRGDKSGGIALAGELAKRLGYTCLSREILVEGARKYNIEEEVLRAELSEVPSMWQRLTRQRHRYLVFVKSALLHAATQDNLIYHGHAGQIFLEGISHVLKVRLEAPLEQRIGAVMAELGLDHDKAVEYIRHVDDKRRRWVRFLYDKEWSDPALYDLTLNLAGMSLETACDIVCHAVAHPDFTPTEASLQRVRDLSLECEVLAGLVSDDKLWDQRLVVSAKAGVVLVRGTVKNQEQKQLVEETVSRVKGVQRYEIYLNLLSDPMSRGGVPAGD
ncbi:MAG: cytidylate kinase family protein [Planctomycetota bacterium]